MQQLWIWLQARHRNPAHALAEDGSQRDDQLLELGDAPAARHELLVALAELRAEARVLRLQPLRALGLFERRLQLRVVLALALARAAVLGAPLRVDLLRAARWQLKSSRDGVRTML